ncbi:MAG: chromate resistance protein ChrB domain-containing protein [Candidatus Omnitrophota bacterium]
MVRYLFIFCLLISVSFFLTSEGRTAQDGHFYSTWDTLELDTCASAWLIKNFVDKEAEFKFYPKGEIITEGMPFDTPDAELRRTANASAYENALIKYKLTDPALIEIGNIIHDIEINYWGQKQKEESQVLKDKILPIIENSKTPEECFKKTFIVLDELYGQL